jgi:glycosyltransferase involved in cell wall biosynthesis
MSKKADKNQTVFNTVHKPKITKQKPDKNPLVSLCTPTFNRRPFIPMMIKCFNHQTYPKDKIEWIIIDDGTDKIEDLVKDIPQVKYFKYDTKMTLGEKRNLMHQKSSGDIIVYMDDDDYYPPQRIRHAVDILQHNKKALCAGSSEMHIYFKHNQKMYQFGPYGAKHATAATFAFKRQLLEQTTYESNASFAEEKHFLKDYTIPFVQLSPRYTILVFSHNHNTFDKRKLLENINPKYVRESSHTIDEYIKDPSIKEFITNDIDKLLENYDIGKPEYKPDVMKAMEERNKVFR